MRNARGIDSMTQSLCNIQASISKMEDSGDFDQTSCAGDSHAHPDDSKRDGIKEIERTAKRSWAISVLVVMLGAMASGGFLYLGITSAHKQEEERFERHAHDLAKEIISSWRDYETAALWIHESCRDWRTGSFTRQDFRVLYNYLIAGGLDFFLAEWVPNITHAERPILEAEAAAYYANDPNVEYKGFVGIQPNPNNPEEFGLFPRTDEPIYFPIHFLEPYERIGEAAHLDLYSIIYERLAIDEAIQKFQPVLTERFTIVSQDTHGYSVSLIHPGVALPSDIYVEPRDLSLMLIHIRSLLERASRYQGVSLDVYLFDATKTLMDESPQEFLGGSRIEVLDNGEKHLTYYDEVELDEIEREAELCYSEKMEVGARTWTIVVVPANDDYQIQLRIAILCSVMIFAASVLLAWIWIIHNRKRSHHVNNIINKAAAESAIVSSLFPANVRALLIQQNQNVAPTKSPEQAVLPCPKRFAAKLHNTTFL